MRQRQSPCKWRHCRQQTRHDVVEVRKKNRPKSFRRCSEAGTQEATQEVKRMANQIREPSDLWDLEHYLTGRHKKSTASRMGFLVLQIIHKLFT